jgi:hypothetical protein
MRQAAQTIALNLFAKHVDIAMMAEIQPHRVAATPQPG